CETGRLRTEIWALDPITLAEPLYDLNCDGPIDTDPNLDYYTESGKVAPDTFVEVTVTESFTDGGLGVRIYESADGARHVVDIIDPDLGDCFFRETTTGLDSCVPRRLAFKDQPWWFGDDTCTTTPLAYWVPGECNREPAGIADFDDQPPPEGRPTIKTPGAVHTGQAYSALGGMCMASDASTWTLYEIGDPLPMRTLGREDVGTGEVGVAWATTDSGVRLRTAAAFPGLGGDWTPFVHTASGLPCRPRRTTAGDIVCMPSNEAYPSFDAMY